MLRRDALVREPDGATPRASQDDLPLSRAEDRLAPVHAHVKVASHEGILAGVGVDVNAHLGAGTRIGRYEVQEALDATLMATVYRAVDVETGERVALKRATGLRDTARWEIEARLMAELDHPGIARLLDHFEEPPGSYNIVTRLIEGEDLGRLLWDRGTPGLPVREVLPWMAEACQSLHYLHDQQIVHGDVKPRNLVRGRDRVVLVDFGLAARVTPGSGLARGGTPRFMAPEVFAGEPASARSDVFGLAATAWNLLTGNPPVYGEDRTLEGIAEATPELEQALRAGLAFAPEARVESAAALAESFGTPVGQVRAGSLAVSLPYPGVRRPLLEAVVQATAGAFDAAAASIALVDQAQHQLVYVAAWGAGAKEIVGMKLARGAGLAGAAAETGKTQIAPRCRTDPRFAAQIARGTGYVPYTMLVLPVRHDEAVIGVLSLLDRRDGEPYLPDDAPRAQLFAELAAAALRA
jgi:eukaryotic-like serine/threonine-protein kinase